MAILNFKNKGRTDIYLTREYNSLTTFHANKDDVKFNDTQNPFSDWCANSTCGNWQDDKIIIKTLPNKGTLICKTNPSVQGSPFAPVTINQEILVRDLIDFKALIFNAEGSADEQFTQNYLTEFSFERYCGATPSNKTTFVQLNMIDTRNIVFTTIYTNLVNAYWETTPGANSNPTNNPFYVSNNIFTAAENGNYKFNLNYHIWSNNGSALNASLKLYARVVKQAGGHQDYLICDTNVGLQSTYNPQFSLLQGDRIEVFFTYYMGGFIRLHVDLSYNIQKQM